MKLLMPFFFSPGRTKRYQDTQVPNPSCLSPPAVSRTSKLVLLRMGDRKAKGRHSSLQGKFPIQTIIGCAINQKQQPINMSLRHSNSPSIKVMRSTEQRCFFRPTARNWRGLLTRSVGRWDETGQSHTGQGTYMCVNFPSGILTVPIKAFNMVTVFEVRTFSGFYPGEIMREAWTIFMCQGRLCWIICNIKREEMESLTV